MKRVTGLKILLGILVVFVFVLLASVFFLQTIGMSPKMVEEKINAVISKTLPLSIKIGEITGNPLTGYDAGPVQISDAQATILSADKLHVSPSLPHLLQGELRLSELRIAEISVDYNRLTRLTERKTASSKSNWDLPIDKIRITHLRTVTPKGELFIEKALVKNKGGNFAFQLNGLLDDKKIKANGELIQEDARRRITGELEWNSAQAQLDGQLSPFISLECTFKAFDISQLHYFVPAAGKANLRGITSGKILISKENNSWGISGDIEAQNGRVWKLSLSNLKTQISYTNRQLSFQRFNANIMGSPIAGNLTLRFPASKDFELDITGRGTDFDIATWHDIVGGLPSVSGKIDSLSMDIRGPIKEWQGHIDLFFTKLVYDKKYAIDDTHGKISFNGEKPMEVLFLGKLYGGTYKASGTIHRTGEGFTLPLSLFNLNLGSLASDLAPLKKAQITGNISASLIAKKTTLGFDVAGTIESPLLLLNKQREQLTAALLDFRTDFKTLSMKRFAASWRGGRLSGEGNVFDLANTPNSRLALRGQLERLSLAAFSDRVTPIRAERVTAVVGGTWALSGSPENPELRFRLSSPLLRMATRKLSLSRIFLHGRSTLSSLSLERFNFLLGKTPFSFMGSIQWPTKGSNIGWNLTGDFSGFPAATLLRMGIISSDVAGTLNGRLVLAQNGNSSARTNQIQLKKSTLSGRGVYLRDINGSIIQSGETLSLQGIQGNVGSGQIRLTGNVTLSQRSPQPLHLKVETTSMDIGRTLRLIYPRARSIQGIANSRINLAGSLSSPRVDAQLSLHRFYAYGFFLPRVDVALIGTPKEIKIKQVKANVGNGALSATAELRNKDGIWNMSMQANGKNLNVRVLSSYLPDETRRTTKGVINFTFNASGTPENVKGKGLITSPSLSIYNATALNIKAPFYIQDHYLTIEEAVANIYGGLTKFQLAADLKSTKWGGRLDIKSGDLTGLIRDVIPDSTGSITGKTNFSLRIAGDTRRTSLLDGSGTLSITDGEVTGFPGVDTLSKAMGNRPLLFKSVISTFTVDGKNLYILPGSRVSAPPDHEAYRYLLADGSANLETGIDLTLIGNVNVRALNIFLSAMQGIITSGTTAVTDTKTIISGLLGNVVKGYSSKEFRDVQFTVRGKPGQFYFGGFAIAPNLKQNFRPDALNDPKNSNQIREQKFMLNIEIPVGSSSDKRKSESVKDQVKGQVLLQAIQGLLNGVSFGD